MVLIFSVGYGLLFERISKFKTLAAIFSFTALGCFMFNFADNPKGIYSFIVMVVIGIGLSGLYSKLPGGTPPWLTVHSSFIFNKSIRRIRVQRLYHWFG